MNTSCLDARGRLYSDSRQKVDAVFTKIHHERKKKDDTPRLNWRAARD